MRWFARREWLKKSKVAWSKNPTFEWAKDPQRGGRSWITAEKLENVLPIQPFITEASRQKRANNHHKEANSPRLTADCVRELFRVCRERGLLRVEHDGEAAGMRLDEEEGGEWEAGCRRE